MEQNNQWGEQVPEKRPPKKKKRKKRISIGRIIWSIFKTLFTLGVVGCLTVTMFAWIFLQYVETLKPQMQVDLGAFVMQQTSVVYYQDRETGEWKELQKLMGIENRTIVEYEQIPKHLVEALISIEDQDFWTHKGVDWYRTAGAVVNMFFGMRNTFGGSTITQQTIKNTTGDNEGNVKRKILEICRALELEKNYEKEDILETYLNLVYFGNRSYGVQAAAETYFGKDVSELDLAESTMIVGLTNNPSRFNPLGKDWQQEAAKNRQLLVLGKMLEHKKIDQATYEKAKNQKLIFVGTPEYEALHANDEPETVLDENGNPIDPEAMSEENTEIFSYFVDALFNDVRDDLVEQKGVTAQMAEQMLYTGGYKIYATIDPELQEIAESVYEDKSNLDVQSAKGQQLQSGISILDPYNGDILAMVGQIGEKEGSRVDNYATAKRPTGSAFKPVSVYAPAIENGVVTPASIYDDYPLSLTVTERNGEETSAGWPQNSPKRYRGLITLRHGILVSTNTNAVRVLKDLSPAASFAFLTDKLSFDLDSRDIDIAPLAMGGLTYGVSTVEMAAAYSAFANNGVYNEPRYYTMVLDADGEMDADGNVTAGSVVLEKPIESWVAMKSTTAYLMNDMLKGVINDYGATGGSARFDGMTIAGKTGTTSNNFDRYFVGYTPYYSAAVWVGYANGNEAIHGVDGNPAAMLWKKVMEPIHAELEDREFITTPAGTEELETCMDCGLLAVDGCTSAGRKQSVRVVEGSGPTEECTCHVTVELCGATVTNEDGTTKTVYHLAGQYCPADTIHYVTVTNVPRHTLYTLDGTTTFIDPNTGEEVTIEGTAIVAEDQDHMMETWTRKGLCPHHTAETWAPPYYEYPGEIYYD